MDSGWSDYLECASLCLNFIWIRIHTHTCMKQRTEVKCLTEVEFVAQGHFRQGGQHKQGSEDGDRARYISLVE